MPAHPALSDRPSIWIHALLRNMRSWRHMLHVGSIVLVLALSPSSYTPEFRHRTARHIYTSTWQAMPWFTALSALLSLVLIRIVVVTALSYGLSQYALQMVVRVLVLELIPLSAALFVALRAGLAFNAGAVDLAARPTVHHRKLDLDHLRNHATPHVLADTFSVWALATLSSVVVLVMTYFTVYGLSPWGLPSFTRTVGQVFDLAVSLGFILKILFFSLAVAVVPMAASLEASQHRATDTIQPGAVRLFLVLFLLEAASLAVKYI
ncbi:ABC transporter permease [Rhodoferax sp.]|uniref:MlaE family ABC transporter permease n=1 Tax=Rhodoferax sp. TaxID=50421 RepID=UPI00260ED7A6|nr:ABC transporter permease [Rhodoferax sp.]MDD3937526.1 ABC transporter permease [Rhodoferax sp.]